MMEDRELIRIDLVCSSYDVEPAFIDAIMEHGLIEVTIVDEVRFVEAAQISDLEKIIRMHYDLDINLAGIETINHLLHRIGEMREELTMLQNRLRFFEKSYNPYTESD